MTSPEPIRDTTTADPAPPPPPPPLRVPPSERCDLLNIAFMTVQTLAMYTHGDLSQSHRTPATLSLQETACYNAALGLLTKEFHRGYRDSHDAESPKH